MVRVRLTI